MNYEIGDTVSFYIPDPLEPDEQHVRGVITEFTLDRTKAAVELDEPTLVGLAYGDCTSSIVFITGMLVDLKNCEPVLTLPGKRANND